MFKSCCQDCCHANESWLVSFLTRFRKERGLMFRKHVVREMSLVFFQVLLLEILGNYNVPNT